MMLNIEKMEGGMKRKRNLGSACWVAVGGRRNSMALWVTVEMIHAWGINLEFKAACGNLCKTGLSNQISKKPRSSTPRSHPLISPTVPTYLPYYTYHNPIQAHHHDLLPFPHSSPIPQKQPPFLSSHAHTPIPATNSLSPNLRAR